MRNLTLVAVAPLLLLACESYAPDGAGARGRIAVSTSALSLPGVGDVCYDVSVQNGDGDVVWTQRHVCSSSYGDSKGAITYVGTCDASAPDHTVSLALTGMTDSSGAAVTDFTNPCPAGDACTKTVTCVEDGDTPVSFDLTVMRSAGQGYFGVSVSVDDVACSATLDCDTPLLTDPESGERAPTAVLALACATGSASAMRMSDVTLDCESPTGPVSVTIDPSLGPGNYFVQGDPNADPRLSQVASFRTTGSSTSSWALAFAPDLDELERLGVTTCTLRAQATASKDASSSWSPPEQGYPYVDWSVPIVAPRDAASGLPTGKRLAMACPRDPATGQASGLTTQVTSPGKHTKTGHVTLMK